ncbi:hypothetical protein OY671_009935, partial [Metschnikowia pulcherrima]
TANTRTANKRTATRRPEHHAVQNRDLRAVGVFLPMARAGGLQHRRGRSRQVGRRQRPPGADPREKRRQPDALQLRRYQGARQSAGQRAAAPGRAARRPGGGVPAAGARDRRDPHRRLQDGRGGGAAVHLVRRRRDPVPPGRQRRRRAGHRRRGSPPPAGDPRDAAGPADGRL